MRSGKNRYAMDCPARCRIHVQGRLDVGWSDYLSGMAIAPAAHDMSRPETVLTGTVPDQDALMGALAQLYDLGLALVSVEVNRLDPL